MRRVAVAALAAILTGCVSWPRDDPALAHCEQYGLFDLPSYAEVLGREPMPAECMPNPPRGFGVKERVVIVRGDGSSRVVYVPAGAPVIGVGSSDN